MRNTHRRARVELSQEATAIELPLPVAPGAEVAVAIVHAADGVRHLVAARTSAEVVNELAEYVRRHARQQLFPGGAKRVLAMLTRGRADEAVRLYFALAGRRWDEERLTLRSVELR